MTTGDIGAPTSHLQEKFPQVWLLYSPNFHRHATPSSCHTSLVSCQWCHAWCMCAGQKAGLA